MNQREAKMVAYFHSALVLEGALVQGWLPGDNDILSEADADRVDAAMVELVDELLRRGGKF